MKKYYLLPLIFVMLLSLNACGANSNTPSDADETVEVVAEEQTETSDLPQTSDIVQSQDPDVQASDDLASNDLTGDDPISDDKTPLSAPAPFETHTGDKEYFYTISDNYILYRYDKEGNFDFGEIYASSQFGQLMVYVAEFYDDAGGAIGGVWKRVFENSDYAEQYAAIHEKDTWVVVENVIYNTEIFPLESGDKEYNSKAYQDNGYDVYVSKP